MQDTTPQLEVLEFIENAWAESQTLEEAMPRVLEAVCVSCAWQWGALWTLDENSQTLVCAAIWHKPELDLPQLETSSRNSAFKAGAGLPGRVWASGQAAWISDVSQDANFSRKALAHRWVNVPCWPIRASSWNQTSTVCCGCFWRTRWTKGGRLGAIAP